jgi:hypothetical protein
MATKWKLDGTSTIIIPTLVLYYYCIILLLEYIIVAYRVHKVLNGIGCTMEIIRDYYYLNSPDSIVQIVYQNYTTKLGFSNFGCRMITGILYLFHLF